ncbi:MAG: ribonuclease H-like domain-containing protein [Myxococcaceae bacterium]
MDLKSKLRRLINAGPESRRPNLAGAATVAERAPPPDPLATPDAAAAIAPAVDQDRLAKLRRRLEELSSRHPTAAAPARVQRPLPGELRDTVHGPLHQVEALLPGAHHHGNAPVARALFADPRLVAQLALDPSFAGVELSRMLLLDTETTGLAGGTGTLPFLIGLGWFEEGRLRLQQLLLRRPGEEGPMLRALAQALSKASCLVTYNGKSFDWPLLRNRFVMNRLAVPATPPHLDLLHLARRVFRRRLSEMRLIRVEQAVLGHLRHDDIDGSEIPERYFDYLRSGDGASLSPVIEHNGQDLTALAGLLGTLSERFAAAQEGADARDSLGFALVASRTRDPARALSFARAAALGSRGEVAADALALVAQLARRQGDAPAAVRALEEALRHAGGDEPRAAALHLALAKAYEHRLRDPSRALVHARSARAAESAAEHSHRIARLERRVAESGQNGSLSFTDR